VKRFTVRVRLTTRPQALLSIAPVRFDPCALSRPRGSLAHSIFSATNQYVQVPLEGTLLLLESKSVECCHPKEKDLRVVCPPGLFNAQCSSREAEVKDCIEAAEADAMPGVRDVMNIVKPQDIGGEGTQTSKDPGITANAAGILSKAAVTHVVRAVLYAPVLAYGFGADRGRQGDVGDE
jgi:hypothetical protein